MKLLSFGDDQAEAEAALGDTDGGGWAILPALEGA